MARSSTVTTKAESETYTKSEVDELLKQYVRKDELAKLIMDNKQWFRS